METIGFTGQSLASNRAVFMQLQLQKVWQDQNTVKSKFYFYTNSFLNKPSRINSEIQSAK